MILGLERDGYATFMPDPNMLIEKGDVLWVVGVDNNLRTIVVQSSGRSGVHADDQAPAEEA